MKSLLIVAFSLPYLALAANPETQPEAAQAAQRQRAQARMRMMRIAGMADALGLDEAQALRIHLAMRPFDERRAALELENAGLAKLIKRAADGDSAAIAQVDQTLQRIWDNRSEIQQLNRQMIDAAGRSLSPRQRAQLTLFIAIFQGELGEMQKRAQDRARQEALKDAVERARENAPK